MDDPGSWRIRSSSAVSTSGLGFVSSVVVRTRLGTWTCWRCGWRFVPVAAGSSRSVGGAIAGTSTAPRPARGPLESRAHGRRGGVATQRHRKPENWLAAVVRQGHGIAEESALSAPTAAAEALLMGLRLSEGVDLPALARRFAIPPGRLVDAERQEMLARLGFLRRGPFRRREHKRSLTVLGDYRPLPASRMEGVPPAEAGPAEGCDAAPDASDGCPEHPTPETGAQAEHPTPVTPSTRHGCRSERTKGRSRETASPTPAAWLVARLVDLGVIPEDDEGKAPGAAFGRVGTMIAAHSPDGDRQAAAEYLAFVARRVAASFPADGWPGNVSYLHKRADDDGERRAWAELREATAADDPAWAEEAAGRARERFAGLGADPVFNRNREQSAPASAP